MRQNGYGAPELPLPPALLLGSEYGLACYAVLMLLILARGYRQQSWKPILKDLLAVLPGVLMCAAVMGWMVSIGGLSFITQEKSGAGQRHIL